MTEPVTRHDECTRGNEALPPQCVAAAEGGTARCVHLDSSRVGSTRVGSVRLDSSGVLRPGSALKFAGNFDQEPSRPRPRRELGSRTRWSLGRRRLRDERTDGVARAHPCVEFGRAARTHPRARRARRGPSGSVRTSATHAWRCPRQSRRSKLELARALPDKATAAFGGRTVRAAASAASSR